MSDGETKAAGAPAGVLDGIELKHGGHKTREEGMCIMEAVAYVAGEPHSDHPACACPVLTAFAIRLNDSAWHSHALRTEVLRSVIPQLIGTRSTPEVERARGTCFVDRLVRELRPMRLEARADYRQRVLGRPEESVRPLRDVASRLRAFPAITNEQERLAAVPKLREIAAELDARWRELNEKANKLWDAAAAAAADAADADVAAAAAAAAAADADADADAAAAAAAADAYAADADARLRILRRAAEILVEATRITAAPSAACGVNQNR